MMNIHQVNSKETMLNENDIVIVAAHMTKPPPEYEEAAKQHNVSTERLLYTVYIQEMQNPALIRIRDGNTLFTIAALENRYGFVNMYNGDTENNVAENFMNFLNSANKFGFNFLAVRCGDDSLHKAATQIQEEYKEAEFVYDKENDLVHVKFNNVHGD